jgi:hypothetical protein
MTEKPWTRWCGLGLIAFTVLAAGWWIVTTLLRNPVDDIRVPEIVAEDTNTLPVSTPPAIKRRSDSDGAMYVGSESCANCHAALCDSYRTHPMSRSTDVVHASGTIEDQAESHRFSAPLLAGSPIRLAYEVVRSPESVVHRELVLDKDDLLICSREVPVHFAIGSGQRGFSYVTNFDGLLFMSPATWYSGEKKWDLSPGYEMNNKHFERRIPDGCVACHVGRVAAKPDIPHTFEAKPFIEMGIGCERCHGPGSAHIAFHAGIADPRIKADPIINPDRLEQPFRDDVCFQCHMSGVGRVTHDSLTAFDFRPGMAVSDIWTIFVNGTKVGDDNTTEAVGQAEQMLSSRCYILSEGAMSCTSCHDPHSLPTEESRIDFYRAKCLNCHSDGDSIQCAMDHNDRIVKTKQDSCIVCHMPRLAANDVPHTSQTDHRVIRRSEEPQPNDSKKPPAEITIYESSRMPADLIDRAKGIFLTGQAESSGDRQMAGQAVELLMPYVRNVPSDISAMEALGTAHMLAYNTAQASLELRKVLETKPDSEYALRQLMFLSHDNDDLNAGIEYGRRLIAVNPWHFEYHGRLAHMLGRSNRLPEAIEAALVAAELQPWNSQIHGWLAEAYRLNDQPELAKKHESMYAKLRGQ